jgi:hypothetical protein
VSILPDGLHTVTYYSLDNTGNFEAANIASIKVDSVAPTIAVPSTITVNSLTAAGTTVNYTVTFGDTGPSGLATSGCSPASGSVFPVGTTTVHCSATSIAGLTTTASFQVLVKTQDHQGQNTSGNGQNHP